MIALDPIVFSVKIKVFFRYSVNRMLCGNTFHSLQSDMAQYLLKIQIQKYLHTFMANSSKIFASPKLQIESRNLLYNNRLALSVFILWKFSHRTLKCNSYNFLDNLKNDVTE